MAAAAAAEVAASTNEKAESAAAVAVLVASTKALEDQLAALKAQHDVVRKSLESLEGQVEEEKVKLPAVEDAIKVRKRPKL